MFRPKHQVLILKTYPKYQKNAAEVKPNSSELSYLLYYASTRRSKLQKVGAFLEKKTANDVYRNRTSAVQVTLQILKALIDKCPRDLPLYSNSVLNVLLSVLNSHDAVLVENSVPTFAAYCAHYDPATLAGDADHLKQYDQVVALYASYASRDKPFPTKGVVTVPTSLRYRSAGLQAVKSMVTADSFASDTGRQLRIALPPIFQNLYSERPRFFQILEYRENAKEKLDKDTAAHRRRQSVALPRVSDSRSNEWNNDADPETATGTTEDVDQRANEEVAVIAMQTLRQCYSADNRVQVRLTTDALLHFVISRGSRQARPLDVQGVPHSNPGWAADLFQLVCRWTPVQDRFVILVTTTEMLFNSPIIEENLEKQTILVRIIDGLLRSSISFIGLSVIDVLVGLINHTLALLQLKTTTTKPRTQSQQSQNGPSSKRGSKSGSRRSSPASQSPTRPLEIEISRTPSPLRVQLLEQMQTTIGDLAKHVYYLDQVGDMVTAILMRLKPSVLTSPATSATAIQNPTTTVETIASTGEVHDPPHTDKYFSFDTARVLALEAVKSVLVVANAHRRDGSKTIGRNRVDVAAWDGTQWLLRDPDARVRKAYVDALFAWLTLELDRSALRVQPSDRITRSKAGARDSEALSLAKRATSNLSGIGTSTLRGQSTFLQLLHLAIYEQAHQRAEYEMDILLLHLLLQTLVEKLGVNALRHGIPMMMRLQDDVPSFDSPSSQVNIASLVYGYLWTIAVAFDFENTATGRLITYEISQRTQKNAWLPEIHVPARGLNRVGEAQDTGAKAASHARTVSAAQSLKPFTARQDLVEHIAESYAGVLNSPPSSPPASPRRNDNGKPPMNRASSSAFRLQGSTALDRQLPPNFKEQMLATWSKEACIASVEHSVTRSDSQSGSKTGSGSGRHAHHHHHHHHQLLQVNGGPGGSPQSDRHVFENPNASDALDVPALGGHRALLRESHGGLSSSSLGSESSNGNDEPIVRVSDLKKLLAQGHQVAVPERSVSVDTGSDSLVSADAVSASST